MSELSKAKNGEVVIDDDGVEMQQFGRRHTGGEPTLIAINGLGSGLDPWGDVLTRIGKERHVVAMDVRQAVGACALSNQSLSYEMLKSSTDVLLPDDYVVPHAPHMSDYGDAVLEAGRNQDIIHDKNPVDVLGFSNGAFVAAQLAIDHPASVDRLVLAAGAPGVAPKGFGGQGEQPTPEAMEVLTKASRDSDTLDPDTVMDLYGGKLGRNPKLAEKLNIKRDIDPYTYKRQLWAAMSSLVDWHDYIKRTSLWSLSSWMPFGGMDTLHTHSTADRLIETDKDTLIIAGTQDPITPYRNAELLHDSLPRSTLYTMEDEGHYGLLTSSKFAVDAISSHLNKRRNSSMKAAA